MQSGQLAAPAKLNLTLEVLARRSDGYHGIRSVAVPIGIYDTISWQASSHFQFTCSLPELAGDENLVRRAAAALGLDRQPLALHLEKRIPIGAGLGGGSSDAAAVLRAAMQGAFDIDGEYDWLRIAAGLGSDVPLFLVESAALVEGRGERVTALGMLAPWHAVVVYPACAIATKTAYAEIDAQPPTPSRPRAQSISMHMVSALQRREFATVENLQHNDFDAPVAVLQPNIAQTKAAFAAVGARAQVSGSGSSVYALCRTEAAAAALAEALQQSRALPDGAQCFCAPFIATPHWREEASSQAVSA